MDRYDIAALVAKDFLLEKGMRSVDVTGYSCEEGEADVVCADGLTHVIVAVQAAHKRGGNCPKAVYNVKKMRRVLMCYLADHPEVTSARYDHMLVTISSGNGAAVEYAQALVSKER